jgi:hypothetical protein
MIIYPTYLYIKQHSVTGLKYFGKTTNDPYTYNGSGTYWKYHIKKHGKDHIETLWVSEPFIDSTLISEYALTFSKDNNIVESKNWANLIEENGLDGGVTGSCRSEESKTKIGDAHRGKTISEETKHRVSVANIGKTRSPETRSKISAFQKGIKHWNNGTISVRAHQCPGDGWVNGRGKLHPHKIYNKRINNI